MDTDTLHIDRRRALLLLGGAGLATLVGCSNSDSGAVAPASSTSTTAGAMTAGATIPQETAGPYPGDGSNGPNVLTTDGIVRRDITPSFGSSSTVAGGVPLTVELTITKDGSPYAGAAVYAWHCDREGRYSLYSDGVTGENYLRGVQEAGSSGKLSFTTVFPAAYPGRWPHIHFEVYPTLAEATKAGTTVATSQLALPQDACDLVYATTGYEQSITNMKRTTLATDMVFSDGAELETPTVTGDVASGFTATLAVAV
ncbi:MAG: Protocatechuate dioxygenase [Actinomycetia bacterium]|nr:Protocatechuate dioxygenase [Actinomycetes bacterium]